MKFFLSFFLIFATIDIYQARVPVSYSSDFHGYSKICQPPLFGCLDGICIPKSWVCDGNDDCLHGEDEYCPLSEISPMEIDEQQPLWKRSPMHKPSLQDLSVYEGAMKLIKESQKDLERGLNLFSEDESNVKTNIRKRNNDNINVSGSSAETNIGNNNTESSLTTDLSSSTDSFPSASTITETTELTYSKTDTSFQSSTPTESSAATEEETEITTSAVTTTGMTTASEPTSTEEGSSSSTDFLSSGTTETTETTEGSVSEVSTSFLSSPSTDSLTSINPENEMTSTFTTAEMITTTEPRPTDTNQSEKLQILNEKIDMLLEINFQLLETLETMENDTLCPTSSFEETTETSSTDTPSEATLDNDTIPVISKTTCPYHFQYMNGICIYAQIYPPVTWREAANLCAAQNSHLLYVKSTAFFEKLLKQLNYDRMRVYDFWIGATNLNINGQWIWSDGSFVTNFEVWGFNLRVNKADTFLTYHKPHQCGFLDGNIYSYLNEADCQDPKGFICQFSG